MYIQRISRRSRGHSFKIDQNENVNWSIGPLINEFVTYCNSNDIYPTPTPFYSIKQKEFAIS